MGKGARNKKPAAAAAAAARSSSGSSREVHDTEVGVKSVPEVAADVGILTNWIAGLLGALENMSLQLGEISSSVNGVANNSRNALTSSGKSTTDEPVMDSERDIVSEFRNLKQITNVAEYRKKFEELRDLMVKMNYGFSEGYLVSSFLSGLKPEIKLLIGNHKPKTLCHAFNLASMDEMEMEMMKVKLMSSGGNEQKNMPSKYLLVNLGPDHPLKFGALVGEKPMKVLVCHGLDYSYLDTSSAVSAGCQIEEAEPLLVDFPLLGYKAVSRFRCPRFRWTVKGEEWVADVRIVEIEAAYQVLLGKDWLRDNYLFRITSNRMTCERGGKMLRVLDNGRLIS